jgi:hypothetical protein
LGVFLLFKTPSISRKIIFIYSSALLNLPTRFGVTARPDAYSGSYARNQQLGRPVPVQAEPILCGHRTTLDVRSRR